MIDGLKPYPAYKDSGVPWLGEVPAHWEVQRLTQVAQILVSNVDKHMHEGETPVRLCNYVDVYNNERITDHIPFMVASAAREEVERFRVRKGDVAITKDSEMWNDIAVPALAEYEAPDLVYGYHLAILRPHSASLQGSYLFRATQSEGLATQFHVAANGVTRFGLTHNAIKTTLIPLPPLLEQAAIVHFLDWADRRIRRVIRAGQKRIKLLEEYKQGLIQRAVTGQIDVRTGEPYPAYKPSGVEWLGQVPEHWYVRRNGQLFAQRNETGLSTLPILEVSLRTGIQVRDLAKVGRKQVMSDREKYKRAVPGDIAYNMMRMWQGAVGIAPVTGLVSPAYVVARPRSGTDGRFFASLFRTAEYMREVDKYSRGIVKDRNRLYWEDFKRISSPCPPCEEQEVIAGWIELLNQRVAHTSSLASTEIALIREFRSQLIADVVTGKLDVRKVAGRLPEEPEAADVGELNDPLGGPSERRVMGPDELAAPKPAGS